MSLTEQRISELETKVAFQEETIDSLNQTVVELNQRLDLMQRQIKQLADKVMATGPSQIATQAEETPPPHY
ncbi:SlyX family protein [Ferrimonas futtsuensis]|uniref:SlyX family protein n=1 Tax=Ferrimonas futtsuensis TaxID=364764 RepID=UPI00040745B4|nr:SlyX family protein [Ferrimonas futtsuensis]